MTCTVKITHPLFLHLSLYLHMGPFPYNPITLFVLCISVMSVRPHPLRWSFKLINLISNTIWTCPRGWKHHKGSLSLHLCFFSPRNLNIFKLQQIFIINIVHLTQLNSFQVHYKIFLLYQDPSHLSGFTTFSREYQSEWPRNRTMPSMHSQHTHNPISTHMADCCKLANNP